MKKYFAIKKRAFPIFFICLFGLSGKLLYSQGPDEDPSQQGPSDQEIEAQQFLREAECHYLELDEDGYVIQVTMARSNITSENITALESFTRLKYLTFSWSEGEFPVSGFESLGKIQSLEILMFYEIDFGDVFFEESIREFGSETQVRVLRVAPIPADWLSSLDAFDSVENLCIILRDDTDSLDCNDLPQHLQHLRVYTHVNNFSLTNTDSLTELEKFIILTLASPEVLDLDNSEE